MPDNYPVNYFIPFNSGMSNFLIPGKFPSTNLEDSLNNQLNNMNKKIKELETEINLIKDKIRFLNEQIDRLEDSELPIN